MQTPSIFYPLLVAALATAAAATHAERADRSKPLTMESDRPCTVDLLRQISVCSGNVVIAQGTLQIRADRVELRETPEGYRQATATGTPGQPAQYRQKRDGGDETIEGWADRVEYDARADTLRFVGNVEARDVYSGAADVVVCDGFTGNVAIKVSEGLVAMVDALLTREWSAAVDGHPGYEALRAAFDHVRRRVDSSEYGGAPLLGVGAACIVGHGRSSVSAVRNAILLAHRFATEGIVARLEQDLQAMQGTTS